MLINADCFDVFDLLFLFLFSLVQASLSQVTKLPAGLRLPWHLKAEECWSVHLYITIIPTRGIGRGGLGPPVFIEVVREVI